MKLTQCLATVTTILVLASATAVHTAERQRGIKMLITAASHHHQSGSGAGPVSPAAGGQTGIDKLIAAATASRHLPPVGVGPHAFRDAASEGEARDPVDIVAPHAGAGAEPLAGEIGRSVRLPAAAGVIGTGGTARATGFGPTAMRAPMPVPGLASMPNTASRLQRASPVFVHQPAQNWGAINGTASARPNLAAIGGAGTTGHPAAGINGTTFRPKR